MKQRLKRLVVVILLLVFTVFLSQYAAQRPVFEKHEVSIPVDSQVKNVIAKNQSLKDAVDLVQDFYWNAWLSKSAIRNGGWKNILTICTKDFQKAVKEKTEVQDSLSLGSVHKQVNRTYLDRERSRIVSVEFDKNKKDVCFVLADVWLGIDQKSTGDYFIHQQAVFELKKESGKWLVQNFIQVATEIKPADIIPE